MEAIQQAIVIVLAIPTVVAAKVIAAPAVVAATAMINVTTTVFNWMLEVPFVTAQELLKTVKPGDLIEFNRNYYMHWAMYSGEGMVINMSSLVKNVHKVTIQKEKLIDVAGNSKVRINNQEKVAAKLGLRKRSPAEALAAAEADLGKTHYFNFTSINCEYISTKWLYGRGFSTQVDRITSTLINSMESNYNLIFDCIYLF